jgi:hypothetical protein
MKIVAGNIRIIEKSSQSGIDAADKGTGTGYPDDGNSCRYIANYMTWIVTICKLLMRQFYSKEKGMG